MSDQTENIIISIQQVGVAETITNLKNLGTTGQQAAQQVAQALVGAGNSTSALKDKVTLLTQAIASGEQNIAAYAEELNSFSAAELSAAAAAAKLETAEAAAAESIAAAETAAAAGGAAMGGLAEKTTTAGASFGGLKTILATVGGLFAVDKIKQASDEYTTISNRLTVAGVSASQFDQIYAALLKTADDGQTDIGNVARLYQNLAVATKDLNLPTQSLLDAVNAVTQGLYQNGVSGTASSRVLKDFSEVLTGAGNSSRLFNSVMQQAPGFLAGLAAALNTNVASLEKQTSSTKTASKGTTDYGTQIAAASNKVDALNKKYDATNVALNTAISRGKSTAGILQQQQSIQTQLAAATSAYTSVRDKATQADQKAASALSDITPQKLVEGLDEYNKSLQNTAAIIQGSLSGALVVLNNQFVTYIGNTNKATGASAALRDVIIAIADNLNIIIPVVAAFIGAWAISKVITTINSLVVAINAIGPGLAVAGEGFALSIGGWVVLIAGVVIGIGYLLDKLGLLQPLLNFLGDLWNKFWAAQEQAVQDFENTFGLVWDSLKSEFSNFVANWNNGIEVIEEKWDAFTQSIVGSNLFQYLTSVLGLFNNINQASQQQNYNLIQQHASPQQFGPGFASGGSFTIPGGGPTDSVPVHFMATPGETVSIRTPSQMANIPHMRDGGDIAITNGLSGTSVTFIPSTDTSVTGYTTIAAPTATADATTSTGVSSPAVTSIAATGESIAQQIADALSIYSTSPETYQRSIDALSYQKGTPTDTQYLPNDIVQPLKGGVSITSVYGGGDADAIISGPLYSIADGTMQTAYDNAELELKYFDQLTKEGFGPNSYDLANNTLAAQNAVNAGAIPWNSYRTNLEAAANNNFIRTYGLGSVTGGTNSSLYNSFQPTTSATSTTAAPFAANTNNNAISSANAKGIAAENALFFPDYGSGFRDGGDVYVPGGGPVDSRFVGMNVSPGESIHVRTPAQRANANAGRSGQVIHIHQNITARNTDDVRSSQSQLASKAAVAYSRSMRRSGF